MLIGLVSRATSLPPARSRTEQAFEDRVARYRPTIKINLRRYPADAWLESSLCRLVSEAGSERPGPAVLLSKMAEAVFIETLRRYMEELPVEGTGSTAERWRCDADRDQRSSRLRRQLN